MSKDLAISVKKLSKDFKLPHQKAGSIKNIFTNMFSLGNRTYETQHALKEITFDINKGDFFGIVGRNGSGKSTLLKILAGIYQPTSGNVSVAGKIVPFIELGVGFNPELTGRENVYLNGALLGFDDKQIDEKYRNIVDFAELERFMDQKLKNYSSGMQVRLAFSVATQLAESDILLIDEVLAVGDADFQRKCFRYFKSLKKQKKTVVFVTHDMNAVREYCNKAILIEEQEIVLSGNPEKIAKRYEKLLQPQNDSSLSSEDDKIWGDESMLIKSPKVNTDEKSISISGRLLVKKSCDDVSLGFLVKNSEGKVLFGTNSTIEKVKSLALKKGQQINFDWNLQQILPEGDYTVTMAAQYDGGNTTAMWWEDAVTFSITRISRTPYIVQPEYKLKFKELS